VADDLTPTSYLVLGAVARRGPSTPYELKQMVADTVGNFWSFPHSQLYSEPQRLAERGLLSEQREEGGRRRRVFSITDAGLTALRQWLATPTPELTEIRDVALLKLFFGGLGEVEDVAALARSQQRAHEDKLAVYQRLASRPPPARDEHGLATLRLGLAYERAAAEFWRSIADDPPAAAPL
jgi:DNA-binding PadR family transcriptional regulator